MRMHNGIFPDAKVDIHDYLMETIVLMVEEGKSKLEIYQFALEFFTCGVLTLVDKAVIDDLVVESASDDDGDDEESESGDSSEEVTG